MRNSNTWNWMVAIGLLAMASACSSSDDSNTGTSETGTGGRSSTGGGATTGGAKPTGGTNSVTTGGSSAATTGGASSATGGAAATTGGTSTSPTGGAPATGGATSTGGASTADTGGSTSAGGASGTGGSAAAITCPLDDATSDSNFYGTTAFCTPSNPDLSLITGSITLGTQLNINASNGSIDIVGTPPLTGPIAFTRPFNSSNCANSGLNATVTGSNPAQLYTGLTFTIANSLATSTTLNVYLADRVTANGADYYVVGTASIVIGANATITQTVQWSDLTTDCSMGSAESFDPTQVLALTLGFPTTDAVNLTISSVTFSTN